jgi:probable FeS assembly SUF system protein SufT
MISREEVTLGRDVRAVQIPDGHPILLPNGSRVLITQQLGGSYTVMNELGGIFRIDERDADALGKEVPAQAAGDGGHQSLEERVWDQMKKCYDPEIPVNIVDLGLVYDCSVDEPGKSAEPGATVHIKMTLTAPGCGMGPVLADDVKRRLEEIPGVGEARVEVVFDPPWNPNMMTEAAKLQLGFM